jgi:PAS domain S-box-containing protein
VITKPAGRGDVVLDATLDTVGTAGYDDLPDGVVVAGADGVVVSVNPAAGRILGSDPRELAGRPLGEVLPLIDPQGRDWWACTRPFDGLRSRVRQPERLLTLSRAGDHDDRELLVTASYVRSSDRELRRVVVCLRDTSARSRQERSGAELVSVVAHELRSPLTSVKGFTHTLLTKWDRFTDEQRRHMLATVNTDADRVTRLITELLDVSRIENGRLELHKQVVDVATIVRRDVAARVASGEAEDRFVVSLSDSIGEVWGDPDKLAQVVGNLIENALRHGEGTVTVTLMPDGAGLRLEVVDEGDGIAPEALPRVFTKFWRGSRRGGTGLGLYIAKGIIDAHDGTIEAGRAPTGGARVGFVLPDGTPSFAR